MFLNLEGCWNCHSMRVCMESSLDNIGRWSQLIDLSFSLISSSNIWWCRTSFTFRSSERPVCGVEYEVGAVSTAWEAAPPSTGWILSSWLERAYIFGSGPSGFAWGSRLLYCLRRAVCQLSMLIWQLPKIGNEKVKKTRTTPYDHKTMYKATYAWYEGVHHSSRGLNPSRYPMNWDEYEGHEHLELKLTFKVTSLMANSGEKV